MDTKRPRDPQYEVGRENKMMRMDPKKGTKRPRDSKAAEDVMDPMDTTEGVDPKDAMDNGPTDDEDVVGAELSAKRRGLPRIRLP